MVASGAVPFLLGGGRSAANGIQPCTSPLRRITNFDAQDYKFGCATIRINFGAALARGLSTGRRGQASSALQKHTLRNRRKLPRPATSEPRPPTSCKIAPSRERTQPLEQWQCPRGSRLRPDKRKKEPRPAEMSQTVRPA